MIIASQMRLVEHYVFTDGVCYTHTPTEQKPNWNFKVHSSAKFEPELEFENILQLLLRAVQLNKIKWPFVYPVTQINRCLRKCCNISRMRVYCIVVVVVVVVNNVVIFWWQKTTTSLSNRFETISDGIDEVLLFNSAAKRIGTKWLERDSNMHVGSNYNPSKHNEVEFSI